ncbi:LOW QUALITY PROTEIN: hypothetical protein CVT26_014518 [Gymnopilus dilepis]|uniref:Uncharacterized protein n=1 Tax=Gymnopilus dilepis TaxID=231916 RepID=A0A409W3A3_9AGAR|nr:LOW QUALITY PROTEIN: hypothetical protein CVT26_014518 [Gymnopilus dilepis]
MVQRITVGEKRQTQSDSQGVNEAGLSLPGVEDDDDDLNVGDLSETQVSKVLEDEASQDPTGLFDNDNHVGMTSVMSGNSCCASSSEASRPPTSDSEGTLKGLGRDTQRETAFISERQATLPTGVSSKNSKGAKSSAPLVSMVKVQSDTEEAFKSAKNWPACARLNAAGQLSVQTDPIRSSKRHSSLTPEHRVQAYKKLVLSLAKHTPQHQITSRCINLASVTFVRRVSTRNDVYVYSGEWGTSEKGKVIIVRNVVHKASCCFGCDCSKKASQPSQSSKATLVEKFEGDQFKAIFDQHVAGCIDVATLTLLKTLLKTRPNTYHVVIFMAPR